MALHLKYLSKFWYNASIQGTLHVPYIFEGILPLSPPFKQFELLNSSIIYYTSPDVQCYGSTYAKFMNMTCFIWLYRVTQKKSFLFCGNYISCKWLEEFRPKKKKKIPKFWREKVTYILVKKKKLTFLFGLLSKMGTFHCSAKLKDTENKKTIFWK